jgi:hypothetical protein
MCVCVCVYREFKSLDDKDYVLDGNEVLRINAKSGKRCFRQEQNYILIVLHTLYTEHFLFRIGESP